MVRMVHLRLQKTGFLPKTFFAEFHGIWGNSCGLPQIGLAHFLIHQQLPHFGNTSLMLAFLRDANTSASGIRIFNLLYDVLGIKGFEKLFPVILTDNGSEFSNPIRRAPVKSTTS